MWPENLECSKFPEQSTNEICISNNSSGKSDQSSSYSTPVSILTKHGRKGQSGQNDNKSSVGFTHRSFGFICPVQLKAPAVMGYELNVAGKVVKDCGAPCNSLFFEESDRTFLRYWISSWAALSVASCLFTVSYQESLSYFFFIFPFFQILTFIIDSSRFRYPERPIVFLAICYLLVGCAYVSGLGAGDTVACREAFQPHARLGRLQMISTITQVNNYFFSIKWRSISKILFSFQGHRQSFSCTVLFIILYFCSMAAFAWWTCLALAWLLASGFKWGHEAIEAVTKTIYFSSMNLIIRFFLAFTPFSPDCMGHTCCSNYCGFSFRQSRRRRVEWSLFRWAA